MLRYLRLKRETQDSSLPFQVCLELPLDGGPHEIWSDLVLTLLPNEYAKLQLPSASHRYSGLHVPSPQTSCPIWMMDVLQNISRGQQDNIRVRIKVNMIH